MPPICLHLGIAQEAARRLNRQEMIENLGVYLLGSTFPDVRIVTGTSREETHFFDLIEGEAHSSVRQFLKTHPDLGKVGQLSNATKAFVAGYLSHLLTDEVWIVDVYRPFFGGHSPLKDDPQANLLDRVLQFELDLRERRNQDNMAHIRDYVCKADLAIEASFVDAATLSQWRDFVCLAAGREPSWERFHLFARRFLLPENKLSPEHIQQILNSVPELLQCALENVGEERLALFKSKSIAESVRVAKEYLG